jgi:hypothetical protein
MTDHCDVSVIGPGAGEGTLTGQPEGTGFEVYDTEFEAVLGDDARLELVAETDAHEGPVYHRPQFQSAHPIPSYGSGGLALPPSRTALVLISAGC